MRFCVGLNIEIWKVSFAARCQTVTDLVMQYSSCDLPSKHGPQRFLGNNLAKIHQPFEQLSLFQTPTCDRKIQSTH